MTELLERVQAGLAGRYRIGRELGRGGTATVYDAEDLRHGREVAIKLLRPDAAAAGYDAGRFLREIRLAAALTHPNILPIFDSGRVPAAAGAGELLYYVTPVMGCETLRERLARVGRLDVRTTLRLARALGSALDYAHRHGVVHRDIKPENILLQEEQPVLCDFGVARARLGTGAGGGAGGSDGADPLSLPGFVVGTPAYMSPEQVSGERELDGRSDQYSLACVVYELLAGAPPFAGRSARAIMASHVVEPPPPLRAAVPEAPAAVERALARALAKDPAERFPTVIAFVEALEAPEAPEPAATPGTAGALTPAIAVLPFVDASADHAWEYLSDGLTEELITALAQVEGLRVASRTSVFALAGGSRDARALGARLGVSTLLEGTVRVDGTCLRLHARLTDAGDGRLLWSARYDRELADVFALEEELARTIVQTLRATLLPDLQDPVPRRYTEDVQAYALYLKGRYHWNRRTQAATLDAIGFFEQAIARDPNYALAYTGLSDAYALQVDYRGAPVVEGMERAKTWARRALALDETLAEAHTSLAWVLFIYDWDWPAAERAFRRALELEPRYATAHQWYAWYLMAMGRPAAALEEGRTAVELDPGSAPIRRGLGWLCQHARENETAVVHLRRALAMDPTAAETHRVLGLAQLGLGRWDAAEVALAEALAADPGDPYTRAVQGLLRVREGRVAEAQAIRDGLRAEEAMHYVSPVAFAILHVALGEWDAAFAALERAYTERRGWLAYLRTEPLLDPLRGDPRFADLQRRMRLA